MSNLARLLLTLSLALVVTSAGMFREAHAMNLSVAWTNPDSGLRLAGCVKICGTYGTCVRNGHRARCCTRWICR